MPGDYVQGFPNPSNSPNEKFLYPKSAQLWESDLFNDLVSEGVDERTARAMARAIARHEDRREMKEDHSLKELEYWANTHTHPGGTSIEFSIFPRHEIHWFGSASTDGDRQSNNEGETWETVSTNIGASRSITWPIWTGTYFFVLENSRRKLWWADSSLSSWTVMEVDASNSRYFNGIEMNPDTGLLVASGGDFDSNCDISYCDTSNLDPTDLDNWTHIVIDIGSSRLGAIHYSPELDQWLVSNDHSVWIATDPTDTSDWSIMSTVPGSTNQNGSTQVFTFNGQIIWLAASGTGAGGFYRSTDGSSWTAISSTATGGRVCYTNGGLLIPVYEPGAGVWELLHTTDGTNFTPVEIGGSTQFSGLTVSRLSSLDSITVWIGGSSGSMYYTNDPTGTSGWKLSSISGSTDGPRNNCLL